jgi:hypothetical protein
MATITLAIASNAATASKTWNMSEADATAFVNFLIQRFTVEGTVPTTNQALAAWARTFAQTIISDVQRQQLAAARAAVTATPVVLT